MLGEIYTENGVIKTGPLTSRVNEKGLGNEFFTYMKKYKNKSMQIQAETGETETFGKVLQKAIAYAIHLKKITSKDDIVCICSDNNLNAVVPFLACTFLGIKTASLDPSLSFEDTIHLMSLVEPKLLHVSNNAVELSKSVIEKMNLKCDLVNIESEEFNSILTSVLPEEIEKFTPIDSENIKETILIFFSSGTTGFPKGICLNHYGLLAISSLFGDSGCEVKTNNVAFSYPTLYWISTINFLISSIQKGFCRVLKREYVREENWQLIEKYKITYMYLAPYLLLNLIQGGKPNADISSLKVLTTGGGPITAEQIIQVRNFLPGILIFQGFGQTENSGIITCFVEDQFKEALRRPGSCGHPLKESIYKVIDVESGEILGPNKPGELYIKTTYLMNGYYKMDSSSCFDDEGFLKTGDVVYYDEEFFFYHVDRVKEMLKYKSWHVPPAIIEKVLLKHEAVKFAIVIGIPHPEDGDHSMGIVILKDGRDVPADEIRKFVDERVDDRKKLRGGLKIVKNFPVTSNGKIQRLKLRKMVLDGLI